MEGVKRTLDILMECITVLNREGNKNPDAARDIEKKLNAARRILKEGK